MIQMSNLNPIAFMRNSLLKVGMTLVISGVMASSGLAAETGLHTLGGHVPAAISRLNLQPTGELSDTNVLHLAIGLPLRNTNQLSALLEQIYDPSSPNYHQFLTPDQFTTQFGPSEQDYASVSNFAAANGLTITGQHRSRMLLDVSGKASDIEKLLHVKLHTYRHPTENREFFAPDTDPSVPADLPIIHISGLENMSSAKSALRAMPSVASVASTASTTGGTVAHPTTGSGPGGTYQGSDFRNAYVPGTTLTGSGQNVGLFQLDGFYPSDISAYESQIGLVNGPQLVVVPIDGGVPTPTPGGNPEVSLDIEMVLSMSPGVSSIYVYEGPNQSSSSIYTVFEDVYSRMADDDVAKQLSESWFIVDGNPDPVSEQIFQQMALQGQSFFTASGDDDAYTGLIPFPCDSPHITLVGGTTLSMNGTAASYSSETVWNWDVEFGPQDDGTGSGGGVSTTYSIPSWQTNINMQLRGGSSTRRNVPDVALTADNVLVFYGAGQEGSFGGTSCAAPLWAGFTALVNQQAALLGKTPVGFLNPALYTIANGANYANDFHDITTGNDEWSGSPSLFVAEPNYDLCTGLGTPNGTNMINALAVATNSFTHLSPPSPPYGTTLSALTGSNPNGNWDLFIANDSAGDSGVLSNGWSITLSLANPVGYAADNSLTMTATAGLIPVGNDGVYTLAVTNYGPSTSSNVTVSDTLPLGATVVSNSASIGTVKIASTSLSWSLGNLTNGAGGQLTVTVQPQTSGNFLNTANVTANTPDPNPADDSASATIVVGVLPPAVLTGATSGGSSGAFQFSVNAPAGETNIIQGTTNLIVGPWINLSTNVGSFTFTNSYFTGSAAFFRVITLP
jgi:uncharacterized repeat protein (TIGR01451 family)